MGKGIIYVMFKRYLDVISNYKIFGFTIKEISYNPLFSVLLAVIVLILFILWLRDKKSI